MTVVSTAKMMETELQMEMVLAVQRDAHQVLPRICGTSTPDLRNLEAVPTTEWPVICSDVSTALAKRRPASRMHRVPTCASTEQGCMGAGRLSASRKNLCVSCCRLIHANVGANDREVPVGCR